MLLVTWLKAKGNLRSGNAKEAVESFKKAAELYPGWIEVHKALLAGYQKLSLTQEAQKEAAQIAQLENLARTNRQ
jgi:Flp pilus assembly protein TadD